MQPLLARGAVKSGANISLAARERGERNFKRRSGFQPVESIEHQCDCSLVFAFSAFRHLILLNRPERKRPKFVALRLVTVVVLLHQNRPLNSGLMHRRA